MGRRLLLTEDVGYHPKDCPGKRKRACGNRISADVIQVNMKVAKAGSKPVGEHFTNLAEQKKA